VTVHGHGTWTYSNNSGGSLRGGWTETFSFSWVTRKYLWGFDVNGTYTDPSVWFWVPTPLSLGETVPILDSNYTVSSLSSTFWEGFPPVPKLGARMDSSGSHLRVDDYGQFQATWTDSYWFNPSTGFLIGEVYTEHDDNSLGDGFDWKEVASVVASSYPIATDYVSLVLVYVVPPVLVVGAVGSVVWYHRGPRHTTSAARPAGRVTVRRVRRPARYLALPNRSSSTYAPLLPVLVRRARQRRNPVWVATTADGLVGAMVRDRRARVATLYTRDPAVAQLFRSMHHARNFFAEVAPPAWKPKASPADTFQLLERTAGPLPPIDLGLIRPMEAFDLPRVKVIAEEVYAIPEPTWLEQCFQDGDLGFVVGVNPNEPDGFAFATVAGDVALLHSLTVSARARGRGFGLALTAARLSSLQSLGVTRVLTEVSTHNPASLAIARRFGFRPVGQAVYYSRQPRRSPQLDRGPAQ
jgi:ribosomal protein S18 acetylase RimI-like enzyme